MTQIATPSPRPQVHTLCTLPSGGVPATFLNSTQTQVGGGPAGQPQCSLH